MDWPTQAYLGSPTEGIYTLEKLGGGKAEKLVQSRNINFPNTVLKADSSLKITGFEFILEAEVILNSV